MRTRAPELSQRIGPSEVACLLGAQLPDALAPDESHRWESPGSWLDFRVADNSLGRPLGLPSRSSVGCLDCVVVNLLLMQGCGRSIGPLCNFDCEHKNRRQPLHLGLSSFPHGRAHRDVSFRRRCSLSFIISLKSTIGRISIGPSPYLKPGCCETS